MNNLSLYFSITNEMYSSNHSQPSLKLSEKIVQTLDTDNETPVKFSSPENVGTFSKELIQNLYDRIVNTNTFNNFENLLIEWIKNELEHNDLNVKAFLESIQNHPISFSSLIGFFYQHG